MGKFLSSFSENFINPFKSLSRNHIDGLVQERRNSIANTLELRLSCSKTLTWNTDTGTFISSEQFGKERVFSWQGTAGYFFFFFFSMKQHFDFLHQDIDGLVQERRNSVANTLELRFCCTNPLIWSLAKIIRKNIQETFPASYCKLI